MTFARTDEQDMLAQAIDQSLAGDCRGWDEVVVPLGLDALGIPEDEGGLGTDLRDAAVVAAGFGRANAGLPWAEHWVATAHGARGEDGPRAADDAGALRQANDKHVQDRARDDLALLHSAEMIGLCRTMMADTAAFLHQRQQFGKPIAGFQVLRHRMADMAMRLEQAEALVDLAIDAGEAERRRLISAARVMAGRAAQEVGEGAVQLHGAMGLTAELRLGGYFRRLRALMQGDGTAAAHLARYAAA